MALAFGALAICAAPAAAALDTDGPNGPLTFDKQISAAGISWSMTGVPDIDQARGTNNAGTKVGLPNGGYMYCVPTTGMDFLAYLADRGFAGSLGVPSKDWTLAQNFNEMSVLLAQLGGEMGTDPIKGTGGAGFIAAMTERLAESEIGAAQTYYAIDQESGQPTVSDVIESGADGALLAAGIGFYKDEGEGDEIQKRRSGGHAFTVVGGSGLPGSDSGTLLTRDPGTVYTADTTQGAYTTDTHTISPLTATFVYEGNDGKDHTYEATRGRWDGSETKLFEGFTRIVPKTAWAALGKDLARIPAFDLVPDPGPLKIFEVPGDGSVKGLALSGATNEPAFLVNGSSNVYGLDPLSGESTKLDSVKGARALTFGGPSQLLYVAGSERLVALDRAGKVVDSRKLSAPLNALEFDDVSGRLGGISEGQLLLFDTELNSVGARALPAAAKEGPGAPLLAFGPQGNAVIGKQGGNAIFQSKAGAVISRSGARRAASSAAGARKINLKRRPLRGGGELRGLAIDDLGQVIVSIDGKLRVFGGSGRRRTGSPLDGMAGNVVLAVTRSFDNTAGTPFLETLDQTVDPPPEVPPEPAEPTPPPPQPNLVVTGLQNADTILVKNTGDADAGPFSVQIADASGAKNSVRFAGGLAAGAQAAVERYTCSAGRVFTADSLGEVAESAENDNAHSCG